MSRGGISHYSSRNLEACTVQLSGWSPFVGAGTVAGDSQQITGGCGDSESLNGLLLAGRSPTRSVDIRASRSTRASSGSATVRLVKCSFKQMMSRSAGSERFRWSCHHLKEVPPSMENEGFDSRRKRNCVQKTDAVHAPYKIPDTKMDLAEDMLMLNSMDCGSLDQGLGKDTECRNQLKHMEMTSEISPALSLYGVKVYAAEQSSSRNVASGDAENISVLSPGWSKRQKQLSRALARGLWRWKEDSQARKRRRKAGSSLSGSGRSSDSRRARIYVSDQPTVGMSGPYATCSDIPIPGTDSSGELFFYGDNGGISWDSDFPVSGEAVVHRKDGVDVLHAWIGSDTQSLESGYGSEPGYRGDGELGYEDDGVTDEQDEDERQQLRLSPWRESGNKMVLSAGGIFEKITEEEDLVGDPTSSSETIVQHRLRRRRHDLKLTGQRNRHF